MISKENSKKKKILTVIMILLIALAVGTLLFFTVRQLIISIARKKAYDVKPLTAQQIQTVKDYTKAKKLMIVAHPDDDTIWGGAHIRSGDYFIVCITNARNETRKAEFEKMLSITGNSGYILEYPDKVAGIRDEWTQVRDKIENDLERLMTCKDWELIVTHNKDGEYGHQHHKYPHSIVTELYDKNKLTEPLYCFGTYHSAKKLPDYEGEMTKMSDKQIEYKNGLVKVYESQSNTVGKLWHMAPYEMWTQYKAG